MIYATTLLLVKYGFNIGVVLGTGSLVAASMKKFHTEDLKLNFKKKGNDQHDEITGIGKSLREKSNGMRQL